jgi:hypothetical protein
MSVGTILLILLVIVLLGGFSGFGGGPFYGTGYYGGGGLGLILVIGWCWLWFCSASFELSGLATATGGESSEQHTKKN